MAFMLHRQSTQLHTFQLYLYELSPLQERRRRNGREKEVGDAEADCIGEREA